LPFLVSKARNRLKESNRSKESPTLRRANIEKAGGQSFPPWTQ
jgi:hypothetical protein